MPHPGPDPNFDYSEMPYRPDWQPIPERRWALKFCKVEPMGQDDEMGFQAQLATEVPYIFRGHAVPSFLPKVDDYVRLDSKGRRQDVDLTLAGVQKPTEIIQREEEEKKDRIRQKWEASQDAMKVSRVASEQTPLEAPEAPSTPPTSPEVSHPRKERKEQAQRKIEENLR
jgi:hypothetical protein